MKKKKKKVKPKEWGWTTVGECGWWVIATSVARVGGDHHILFVWVYVRCVNYWNSGSSCTVDKLRACLYVLILELEFSVYFWNFLYIIFSYEFSDIILDFK